MKKTKKRQITLILGIIAIVAIIGFGLSACDNGDGGSNGNTTVAVTGVTVAPTTLALTVGGSTGTLTATVAPSNATNKAVTWSTSNAAVATVSDGIVTAVGAGTAAITVTTTDGNKTATCAVTVTAGLVPEYAIGDTGPGGGIIIYVSASGFNVAGLGICHYLEAAPTNQAKNVIWSSTNVDVTGASGTAIGTGKANTAAIIAAHLGDTASNNAAKAAVTCTSGGKSDWFLPSKDELNEIYKTKNYFDISSSEVFWSSSQGSDSGAWKQSFLLGTQDRALKVIYKLDGILGCSVRAVRAF